MVITEEEAMRRFQEAQRLKKLSVAQIIDEPREEYAQKIISEVGTPQYRREARRQAIARMLQTGERGLQYIKPVGRRPIISRAKTKKIGTAIHGLMSALVPPQALASSVYTPKRKKQKIGRPKGIYTHQIIDGKLVRISASDWKRYKSQLKRQKRMQELYAMARQQQQADVLAEQQRMTYESPSVYLESPDRLHEARVMALEQQRRGAIDEREKAKAYSMLRPIKEQIQRRRFLGQGGYLSSILGGRNERMNLLNQPTEINPQIHRGKQSPEERAYLKQRWNTYQTQPENRLSLMGSQGITHTTPQLDFMGFKEKSILKLDDEIVQSNLARNYQINHQQINTQPIKVRWF